MKEPRFTEQQIAFLQRLADVEVEPDTGDAGAATGDKLASETYAIPGVDAAASAANGSAAAAYPGEAHETEPIPDAVAVAAFTGAFGVADVDLAEGGAGVIPDPEMVAESDVPGFDTREDFATAVGTDAEIETAQLGDTVEAGPSGVADEPLAEISELPTTDAYNRLRRRYAGLSADELARLHAIEFENTRLKHLVAKLIVEKGAPTPNGSALPEQTSYEQTYYMEDDPVFTVPFTRSEAVNLIKDVTARATVKIEGAWAQTRSFATTRSATFSRTMRAAGPAIAELLRNPLSEGAAVFRAARQYVGEVAWARARAFVSNAANTARRKSKGRELLLAGILGGLVAGFAVGLGSSPLQEDDAASIPVDRRIRLNSSSSVSSMLDKGWERPQPWGTWMTGNEASIIIGFDGASRGDVELLVEARTQPLLGTDPPTVIVRFNSVELGRWRLPAEASEMRRRFIVPQAVFNRSTEAHLNFDIPASAPTPTVFGVQAVSLRDVRMLTSFRGFMDSCSRTKLAGWAVAEDIPVSVTATVNGEPVVAVLSSVERPDLASHGLPLGAGFELTPAQPLPAGSKVEVRFANGRPLQGSPCEPSTSEPATAVPATAVPATAMPTATEPTTFVTTAPELTTSEPAATEPTTSVPTVTEPTTSVHTAPELTPSEPTSSGPSTSGPSTSGPLTSGPLTSAP